MNDLVAPPTAPLGFALSAEHEDVRRRTRAFVDALHGRERAEGAREPDRLQEQPARVPAGQAIVQEDAGG